MQSNKKNIYISTAILSLFICISSFLITSLGYSDGLFFSYFKDIRVFIYNYIPIYLIILILTYAFKSNRGAFLTTSILVNLGSYVNFIKIIYREEPLYARDLFIASEGFAMAKKYDLYFNSINFKIFFASILLSIIIFVLLKNLEFIYESIVKRTVTYLIILVSFMFFGIFNFNSYHEIGKYSNLYLWIEVDGYQSKGFLYPFLYSIKSTKPYKYKNYNEKKAKEIYEKYNYIPIEDGKRVNIVAIMLESFKDFEKYESENMIFDKDPYTYFHKLQKESYSGNLLVNSFGGGTFLTETNFLTGYKNCPRFDRQTESYAQYLKNEGYTNYAFHPNVGTFYNRKNVYPRLGFDEFFNYDNTFSKYGEDLLKDKEFFDFIINTFDEKEDNKPYFFFGVTYQNHGPYTTDPIREDQVYIRWNDSYQQQWYNYFNRYLSGIESTSNSLEMLTNYLEKSNEPTVLILFGDHSPSMGDNKICFDMFNIPHEVDSTQGIINVYETPYILWANNTAKEVLDKDFKGVGPNLEAAFLMSHIFEYMGWQGNQYNQYLNDLTKEISILKESWFCVNGEYTNKPDENAKIKIDEFKNMEYYMSHFLEKQKNK